MMDNILLTGIPRSGTTLTCKIFNSLDNVLALVEPIDMRELIERDNTADQVEYILQYCATVREQVSRHENISMKIVSGEKTNTFAVSIAGQRRKSAIVRVAPVAINKEFNPDFQLILKHPNAFAALLPQLIKSFTCYAIVRNPLSVLGSWNSLDHPLSKGHAPMAEQFDVDLKARLADIADEKERQITLLDWYYRQFNEYLPADYVIKYESIIDTNGQVLSDLLDKRIGPSIALENRNASKFYDGVLMRNLGKKLMDFPGHSAFTYYSEADIAALW